MKVLLRGYFVYATDFLDPSTPDQMGILRVSNLRKEGGNRQYKIISIINIAMLGAHEIMTTHTKNRCPTFKTFKVKNGER